MSMSVPISLRRGPPIALALIPLIVGLLLASPAASAQPDYRYLHQAVDEIHQIQRKALKPTAADVAAVAVRACKTLEILLDKDPTFRRQIETLAADSRQNLNYHRQLADDLLLFIESFVPQEHEYLLRAGVPAGTTSDILIAAALSRAALREPLSAKTLLEQLERLRQETCQGAQVLERAQDSAATTQQRRNAITRWALGLGGVSLIAADAVFAVPSGGVATASFTLGGAGVGAAIAR